jgi:hypothetical protein
VLTLPASSWYLQRVVRKIGILERLAGQMADARRLAEGHHAAVSQPSRLLTFETPGADPVVDVHPRPGFSAKALAIPTEQSPKPALVDQHSRHGRY